MQQMTTSLHATPICPISTERGTLGSHWKIGYIIVKENAWKNIQTKITKKIVTITDEHRAVCVHETLGQIQS